MHGTKPYGHATAQSTVFGVQDMGELAARLGSINTYDRRGNVFWTDDFGDGSLLGKWPTIVHTAITVEVGLSTGRSKSGAFSALVAFTAAALAADFGWFRSRVAFPHLVKTGAEVSFSSPTHTHEIMLQMDRNDGATIYTARVTYNEFTDVLAYLDDAGVYQPLATMQVSSLAYSVLKLVIDLSTNKYVRLIFNDTEYDLSTRNIRAQALVDAPALDIILRSTLVNNAVAVSRTYFADVILTTNEP
ncbi:MAG: hypothetical protein MUP81_04565 [Dehalococcoidia bacterium]|nr:hypothetical protein [Dehalococcoidia bacterium]